MLSPSPNTPPNISLNTDLQKRRFALLLHAGQLKR